jgi:L-lactate dehydrogenase complex protein LldG
MAIESTNREAMLTAVRSALAHVPGTALPEAAPLSLAARSAKDLIQQFTENASAAGVQVGMATDPSTASATIHRWLNEVAAPEFLYVASPLINKLRLSQNGVPGRAVPLQQMDAEESRTLLLKTPVGLNEAAAGISDTGTLVEFSGKDKSRLISLLPPTHISILPAARIYLDLRLWLQSLGISPGDRLPSGLTLITGPSRSADIEQSLTIGVHGPGKVYVLILDLHE